MTDDPRCRCCLFVAVVVVLGCAGAFSPTGTVEGSVVVDGRPISGAGCWMSEGRLHVVLDDPELVWRRLEIDPDGSVALGPEKGGGYSSIDGRVGVGERPCGTLAPITGGWRVDLACSGTLRGLSWIDDRMLDPGEEGPQVTVGGQVTVRGCGSGPPW